jgi:uncharacterized coiled-coil DUF342 family protein
MGVFYVILNVLECLMPEAAGESPQRRNTDSTSQGTEDLRFPGPLNRGPDLEQQLAAVKTERRGLARRCDKLLVCNDRLNAQVTEITIQLQSLQVRFDKLEAEAQQLDAQVKNEVKANVGAMRSNVELKNRADKRERELEVFFHKQLGVLEVVLSGMGVSVQTEYKRRNLLRSPDEKKFRELLGIVLKQFEQFRDKNLDSARQLRMQLDSLKGQTEAGKDRESQLQGEVTALTRKNEELSQQLRSFSAQLDSLTLTKGIATKPEEVSTANKGTEGINFSQLAQLELESIVKNLERLSRENAITCFCDQLITAKVGHIVFAKWQEKILTAQEEIVDALTVDTDDRLPDDFVRLETSLVELRGAISASVNNAQSLQFIRRLSPDCAAPIVSELSEELFGELLILSAVRPDVTHAFQVERAFKVFQGLSENLKVAILEKIIDVDVADVFALRDPALRAACKNVNTSERKCDESTTTDGLHRSILSNKTALAAFNVILGLPDEQRKRLQSRIVDEPIHLKGLIGYDPTILGQVLDLYES